MENLKNYSMSATGLVAGGVARINKFGGLCVSTATATATILIRDGAAGPIIAAVPAASAAGYNIIPSIPVQANNGVYFDLNGGTGTISVWIDN